MNSNAESTNRMATEPVNKLMVKVGVPIVLSMILQAVYNVVDSAFLSRMSEGGEDALTALGLAFPMQLLMVAVAIGTGVGANALLSKSMGQGDSKKVNKVAGNAIFLGIVIYVFFLIFGFVGIKPYVNSQNTSGSINDQAVNMSIDYLQICCCISLGIIFFSIFEKMLQSTGRSFYSTIAQVTGAVVNIIADPIFIYGWLGLPEMGVKGAAYATVLGQVVSAVMAFIFHMKLNTEIDKSPKYMKPRWSIIKEIYQIGLPAIISQALITVMTYGMNIILGRIPQVGANAVTVYGLYCKVQQMITFAAFGMKDVITPVVSFSFGMRNRQRVREGVKYGLIYTAALMVIGTLALEIFAEGITNFFSLTEVTHIMCVDCTRIVSLALIFAGLSIAFQGVFQAVECGIESLLVSIGRQVLFILPVAYILTSFITGAENVSLVWWTFLIGEGITFVCTVLMYIRAKNNKIAGLEG